MSRYPWQAHSSETRSRPWIHRKWNPFSLFSLKSHPKTEQLEEPITNLPGPPTTTAEPSPSPTSPLLNLPPELRQKILRYTITDEQILQHLLWESVEISPSIYEARVYYFDGREFAWDDETKMFSRAPFDESRALERVHPLLREDMEYVKRQWIKRVRAIGEEKRVEVMRSRKEGGEWRAFGESSRFPKDDMKKSVFSLMKGTR